MPIYEYTCQKCKAHIEILQKISDKPLTRHTKCGGKLVKEWSQTNFQLKGTGWYVTDYAGKKQEAKDGKEAKAEKPASEAKAEKPAPTETPAAAGDKKSNGKKAGASAAGD